MGYTTEFVLGQTRSVVLVSPRMHTLRIDTPDRGEDVCIERSVSDEFEDRAGISRTVDFVEEKGKVSIRTGDVTGEWDEGNVERKEAERVIPEVGRHI